MSYTNENKSYTERVQCPYCREVIKAPNQPDVTFLCPNCGRELITYDKEGYQVTVITDTENITNITITVDTTTYDLEFTKIGECATIVFTD